MLQIQQTAPGRWLAATVPGRLVVVECQRSTPRIADDLWEALSAGSDVQPVLDYLTRDGLLATPAFALLVWDDARRTGLGRVRCIVRGSVRVAVDTVAGQRRLSADGVSTWLEQLVDDATAFAVDVENDGVSGDDTLLPLGAGAAWVAGVRTREPVHAPQAAEPAPAEPAPAEAQHTVSDDTVAEPFEPDDHPTQDDQPTQDGLSTPAESTTGYDHLFGATMMRNVEEAAVREDESAEDGDQAHTVGASAGAPGRIDPPSYVTASTPAHEPDVLDGGDHDGMTVFSGDIHKLRAARSDAPEQQEPEPTPVAAVPRFTVSITGGATEPLGDLTLVGRAPSVSKVSGGRVPKLITVGSADQDISRNHVQLAVEGDTVVVTDLHSRNGTMIVLPGKSPQKLRQGEPTSVIVGTVVDLGGGVTMTVGQETAGQE